MSIHSSVNMVNCMFLDQEPEWMKSERYEYCEPMEKEHAGLLKKLVSLFV